VLGIYLFGGGWDWILGCITAFVAVAIVMGIGTALMPRWPEVARWLIEAWILSAVCIVGLATCLVLHVSTMPLDWLPGTGRSKDIDTAISGTFVGAISTYVALVWTKDVGDATGDFFPSTRFKKAMAWAFKRLKRKPRMGGRVYEAIFRDENVINSDAEGWEFAARGERAKILAEFLRNPASDT
jgi:hypothetical protein